VQVLNAVYTTFDLEVSASKNGNKTVHKVETVGQVYMVVAGAPIRVENHAVLCAQLALDFMEAKSTWQEWYRQGDSTDDPPPEWLVDELDFHIGLNSGSINAGVCGLKNPRYKLFGDTVNTASRMESTCPPGKIQLSQSAYARLAPKKKFAMKERGYVEVKGKGQMMTYFLLNRLVRWRHIRHIAW
jgi:class 3 adenylate cyclase